MYVCILMHDMIRKLIDIGAHKIGNKNKLGIFMGFNEKYARQRVNELYNRESASLPILEKLLEAADLKEPLENSINKEYKKIFNK